MPRSSHGAAPSSQDPLRSSGGHFARGHSSAPLRGKPARRPRARHGALDAPGASQAIESCKQQSSSAAGGGLTAGIGHRQPRRRRQRLSPARAPRQVSLRASPATCFAPKRRLAARNLVASRSGSMRQSSAGAPRCRLHERPRYLSGSVVAHPGCCSWSATHRSGSLRLGSQRATMRRLTLLIGRSKGQCNFRPEQTETVGAGARMPRPITSAGPGRDRAEGSRSTAAAAPRWRLVRVRGRDRTPAFTRGRSRSVGNVLGSIASNGSLSAAR